VGQKGNERRKMTKITRSVHDQMVEMRKAGAPYPEIMAAFKVSKWACIAHLREVEIEGDWVSEEWQLAEEEAESVLESMGFSHILNLNKICNVAPYWDYFAEKDGEKWLVDVTVNTQKSLVEKQSRGVDGFLLGILYKNTTEWRLLKISTEIVSTKTI
jgi:hypothetical protein